MPFVMVETMLLLTSSFTVGLAMLAARAGSRNISVFWFVLTFLLGAAFLTLELTEFRHLVGEGNDWQRSGFLSGYFTLVGTHGLHILVGLIWMIVAVPRILFSGFTRSTMRRLGMLSLFWHFLDIVWIFIFTIVYLMGATV
jgi:cytochrome o ubiquinol oxidase subunit 3